MGDARVRQSAARASAFRFANGAAREWQRKNVQRTHARDVRPAHDRRNARRGEKESETVAQLNQSKPRSVNESV